MLGIDRFYLGYPAIGKCMSIPLPLSDYSLWREEIVLTYWFTRVNYRMAGNFRGVLIFVIFVVDLAVTKFSHPRKLMPKVIWYHDDGRGHKHRGSAANTFQYSKQQ